MFDNDFISLRTFIAVVDEQSFSRAAERLDRTQSAVSLQIAKLENRLHVKLLNRSTRNLVLTNAGETLLTYARQIIALADEAVLAVTSPDEAAHLRVGFAEYLAPQHLPTLLGKFRKAHPKCDLTLVLGLGAEMLDSMRRGKLDVVFAGPEKMKGDLLWDEPLLWTGRWSRTKRQRPPVDLILMPAPCGYRQIAFDTLSKAKLQWRVVMEANSVQAVQTSVQAGLGVSVLPVTAILKDMPINQDLPALPRTSVICYRPQTDNLYAQRLVDYLMSAIDSRLTHAG